MSLGPVTTGVDLIGWLVVFGGFMLFVVVVLVVDKWGDDLRRSPSHYLRVVGTMMSWGVAGSIMIAVGFGALVIVGGAVKIIEREGSSSPLEFIWAAYRAAFSMMPLGTLALTLVGMWGVAAAFDHVRGVFRSNAD